MNAENQRLAVQGRAGRCFSVPGRLLPQPCTLALDPASGEALAAILPLLGCGEEAAIVSFDRLARDCSIAAASRMALKAIAEDERQHDALLGGLQQALPQPTADPALRLASRRFHRALSAGSVPVHLARIAGIDAAVCTVLSHLLRSGSAVAHDPAAARVMRHIRRDEARHVTISRSIAIAAIGRNQAREAAAQARSELADLLAFAAYAFDRVGVDPGRLSAHVRAVPNGLFPQ